MPKKPTEQQAVKKVKTSLSLPADLWRTTRIRAIEQGEDAQDLVARALEVYLRKGGAR